MRAVRTAAGAPACGIAAEGPREVARIPFPGEFEALAVATHEIAAGFDPTATE